MTCPQMPPHSGLSANARTPAPTEQTTQRIDQLERTNGHQTDFMARLSHELRNLLTPLHHGLALLRLHSSAPETGQTLALMQRQLGHLSDLVDDLLDTERIAQGKLTLHRQRVTLQNLLDDSIAISRTALAERDHRLTLDVPQRPIDLEIDPTRITQVLVNLLINAAKYTPPGGTVALQVQGQEERVVLAVRDNGIGLSEEELPVIFDLYAQTASSRRLDQGGLGVGLALARQIVQLHGGHLKAHSDGPGRGSCFTVVLPTGPQNTPYRAEHRAEHGAADRTDALARLDGPKAGPALPAGPAGSAREAGTADQAQGPARAARPPLDDTAQRALRILVADDHIDGANTLAQALHGLGYPAQACYSGHQALETARRIEPQVALLDLSMPEMDGYELAQRLRQRHPALRLVAMTGWASAADRQRCLQAGFDAHLSKPASIEAIESLLSALAQARTSGSPQPHRPAADASAPQDVNAPSGAAPAGVQTARSSTAGAVPGGA